MLNLLPVFEEDCGEISKTANALVGRLANSDGAPNPALYNHVIREVSALELKWGKHLRLLSEIFQAPKREDPNLAAVLTRVETNAVDMAEQLQARSSAGWARTPELGVRTIRLRVADTLTSLLQQVEEERNCIQTVLQRRTANHPAIVTPKRELAVA